ncbi:MAG: FkbM family methyltransferase, partial [Ginsengibacter sp.]
MNRLIKGFTRRYLPFAYKKIKFGGIAETQLGQLRSTRLFEPELLLLKNFIKNKDVVFDIGANAGEYTYVLEKLAGATYVHSFEPIPKLFIELQRLFPKVNLHKIALSDKEDRTQFKIPVIDGSRFETRGKLDIDYIEPGEHTSELIEVERKTLDLFVKKNDIKQLDFIKIDVEGHELKVLYGADKSIK